MTPLPRDDYAALTRYDPQRRPVALDLSDNTNLWGTHPAALARIRSADADDLARYPELYADTLRDAVSAHFDVDPTCVTTGAGSDDVLDSAFRAAWAPGAVVRYAAPTFSMVEPLALMNGLRAEAVAWPDALEDPTRLLEGRPAVVYVCRPNNPTGTSAPADWIDRLLDATRAEPAPRPLVVLDEAYADFAPDTRAPTAPAHPSLLVARTASKAYGLAGLRCGWGVASAEVALEIDKSRGPYKVARLAAEATAAAIRDEGGWMAETVSASCAHRDRLRRELERRGVVTPSSDANFLLLPAPSGSARDDALALRELGVAVRPFSGIAGMGDGLRVTVGPWPLMERFLDALDQVLAAYESGDR